MTDIKAAKARLFIELEIELHPPSFKVIGDKGVVFELFFSFSESEDFFCLLTWHEAGELCGVEGGVDEAVDKFLEV